MNILRSKPVAAKVGFHPVHIRRLVKAGKFPEPIRLGPNSVGWIEDEVDEWIRARIDERDALKDLINTANGRSSDD